MDQPHPMCQSCAMLMQNQDDYGTEKDNQKNSEYCKYCYKDGSFLDEGISLQEQIKKVSQIAIQMEMAEKMAQDIAQNIIPQLKRWKN